MSSSSAATVLMVNLDNGLCESKAKELKWRRFESLERSISPMANTLIRFSYAEIRAATRNFSKGNVMGLFLLCPISIFLYNIVMKFCRQSFGKRSFELCL